MKNAIDHKTKSYEAKWAEAERQLALRGVYPTNRQIGIPERLPFEKLDTSVIEPTEKIKSDEYPKA